MQTDAQALCDAVAALWPTLTSANLPAISDYAVFKREFRQLFGFEVDGIDYAVPVEVERSLG